MLMIYELKHQRPNITFGLGKTNLIAFENDAIEVWVSNLIHHNPKPTLSNDCNLPKDWIKVDSSQRLVITCREVGDWSIRVEFPDGRKSNIITLEVK